MTEQEQAIKRASVLKVMAVEAGTRVPPGGVKVSFSDGAELLMSLDQFAAIREVWRPESQPCRDRGGWLGGPIYECELPDGHTGVHHGSGLTWERWKHAGHDHYKCEKCGDA